MPHDFMEEDRPNIVSVKKLYTLLQQVVKDPSDIDKNLCELLMAALGSQGKLASLEVQDKGLLRMSLNTQKAIANEHLSGGYDALNDYRKAALKRLKQLEQRVAEPGRGTINWYEQRLTEKTNELGRIADDIALMSQQMDEVLAFAQRMAKEAGKQAEFNKVRLEILRKFKKDKEKDE